MDAPLPTKSENPFAALPAVDRQRLGALYDNNATDRNQADLKALQAASAHAYASAGASLQSHRYGTEPWQWIDVFSPPQAPPTGALVFVHGGRWQLNTSRETAFWAQACGAAGLQFFGLNFPTLAQVGLRAQIDAVASAIASAMRIAGQAGLPASSLCLAGHSSGAHLALAALLSPARPNAQPGGLLLLGGLYDLAPLRATVHQQALGFSEADVLQGSPLHLLAQATRQGRRLALPPTLVAVGAEESPEFVRQSRALHWALQAHVRAGFHALPAAAHFDAALEFLAADSALRRFALHHEP